MSSQLLGKHFDIHGGGQDLQFPHHENEIAQSEGAHQCTFVNYWMHNGFVRVDNEKMSKSLGNFFTIREVLKQFDAEVVRFFILRAHYRSALNYSDAHLDDARRSLDGLYFALRDVPPASVDIDWNNDFAARFAAALNEDFDSHGAISVLFELAGEVNRQRNAELSGLLKALGAVIGLLERDPTVYLRGAALAGGLDDAAIEQLIVDRTSAKKERNFAEADRIRDVLKADGIILDDSPQGTSWRRA
jgi:cysteinyl-tRNA synthetase